MPNTNKIKPSILPGFMELLPKEQMAFNALIQKIRESYELFGFIPVDTPVIEKAEVLMAKGGEEAERQTYQFKKGDNDLALRFDLTVPLARYVSEHMYDLPFPFRRYQIGKVYRGEKPQKGRFREFYQCDIDIIGKGSLSLVNDAEIVSVIYSTFTMLGLKKILIKLNNRKVLSGFMSFLQLKEKSEEILRIIDKLDKIGPDGVKRELTLVGADESQINAITEFLSISGDAGSILNKLEALKIENEVFQTGLSELKEVVKYVEQYNIPESNWKIDLNIARGLEYYTGTVYETILINYPELGSICSGGRYDNLAEFYTDEKLPGVGISIGLTRLFSQLNELDLIEKGPQTPSKVLLISLTDNTEMTYEAAKLIRDAKVPAEVYTETGDFKKALNYANKVGIPFVGIVGEDEIKQQSISVKNMETGNQEFVGLKDLQSYILGQVEKPETTLIKL